MANSKRPPSERRKPSGRANRVNARENGVAARTAKTSSRSTTSGPASKPIANVISDAATLKLVGTQKVAEAFPFNAAKPSEFADAASTPSQGQAVEPPHPIGG